MKILVTTVTKVLRIKLNSFNEHKNAEDHIFSSKKKSQRKLFLYSSSLLYPKLYLVKRITFAIIEGMIYTPMECLHLHCLNNIIR